MKKIILFSFLLFPLTLSLCLADTAADEALCSSRSASYENRIPACTRLIEDSSYPKKSWAYNQRGELYLEKVENQKAIDDFTKVIELSTQDAEILSAYKNRGFVYNRLKNYPAALADIQFVITKEPNNDWNFYFLGRVYMGLKDNPQAIAAFTRAIEINPKYCSALINRASIYKQEARYQDSLKDYTQCIDASPFEVNAYLSRGRVYDELQQFNLAARDYKICNILNENLDYAAVRLNALIQKDPNPTLPNYQFSPPQKNLKIRYLQVLLPRDMRDEMERAIGDLISWFSPRPQFLPVAKAYISRTILDTVGDLSNTKLDVEASQNVPSGAPESLSLFRSMLPVEIKAGPGGPNIKINFDQQKLLSLWPLEVGKNITGNGTFELQCPPFSNPATVAMGCTPNAWITIGKFNFNLYVDRVEHVHVPAGLFKTFVVRYRELGEISILGRSTKREIENFYWIAPELNWWVRRTSQLEDKISVIEATDIIP